jgi:hypothetical protein
MSEPVSTEDFLAVQDLFARYCWYLDESRGEEWAALYTEDGIFEGTRPQAVRGQAQLIEVPSQGQAFFNGKLRHQYGNLYIERDAEENRLVARFYNQVTAWGDGGKFVMLAQCTATLVRASAGAPWRIEKNNIVVLK